MEPKIKIENVFIKEELMMSETSDCDDKGVASDATSPSKEKDLISSEQESHIKEEVISDITNFTENDASNKDRRQLRNKNISFGNLKKSNNQLPFHQSIKGDTISEEEVDTTSRRFSSKGLVKLYCSKCDVSFEKINRKDRKCRHCSTTPHLQCRKCGRRYMGTSSMNQHLKSKCGPKKYFRCAECDHQSLMKKSLLFHIQVKHTIVAPEDYVKCRKCGKGFKHRSYMQSHEKLCGKEPDLQCEYCPYKSNKKANFKRHVQNHILHPKNDVETPDEPSESGKATVYCTSKQMSKEEKSKVQNLAKAYCSKCERETEAILGKIRCTECTTKLTYHCDKCGIKYEMQAELREHIVRKHLIDELKKRQSCPKCGQSFVLYRSMYQHWKYCSGEPKFRCPHCPFKSKYKANLGKHMYRLHPEATSAENPARRTSVCPECGKVYRGPDSLARHRLLYCGKKPSIACAHCEFKSYTKQQLIEHLHALHPRLFTEEALKCKACGRVSTNVYTHVTHVKNCNLKQCNRDPKQSRRRIRK